jgi:peptide/nickel transport system permease protein
MLIMINASLGRRVSSMDWLETIEDTLRIDGFPDYVVVFAALSLFSWVGGARVIRSQVLALRETEYVQAARSMGASTSRIIVNHLLPNVSNIVIVSLSASLGAIAGTEIALTWFGVGVQPPTPSFGVMLFEGGSIRTLQADPHLLLVPGAVVAMLIFSFNLLGDALTDVLTPHAR